MSVEEKEAKAMELLAEVAREKHGGDVVLLRVELRGEGGTLEVIDARVTRPSSS
jgi:hypothetical protein